MRRSGKFYYKNERIVAESLGMKQVAGSGNGWVSKEDCENEFILAQLKSTDAKSISIKKLDIEKLEYNANIAHKTPLFIIQFLDTHELYFLVKPLDVPLISEYIKCGEIKNKNTNCEFISTVDQKPKEPKLKVKSSIKSRNKYWEDKYGNNKN